jgi:hypothetical protein
MSCKSCGSDDSADFSSEILIHFAGRKNVDKPGVLVFPNLTVCLHCGLAEFNVPEAEMRPLKEGRKGPTAA